MQIFAQTEDDIDFLKAFQEEWRKFVVLLQVLPYLLFHLGKSLMEHYAATANNNTQLQLQKSYFRLVDGKKSVVSAQFRASKGVERESFLRTEIFKRFCLKYLSLFSTLFKFIRAALGQREGKIVF